MSLRICLLQCGFFTAVAAPLVAQDDLLSCGDCHVEEIEAYSDSVHAAVRIGCQDCHGGQAGYTMEQAESGSGIMDHGPSFIGKPARFEIPDRCATCHSDVAMMNPYGLPANELSRYRTSGHGKALYEDHNPEAAVCTDCHKVHDILKSSDPRSATNPVNVPTMCGQCHGNAEMMNRYGHHPEIMTEYRNSVHGRGLVEDHDTGMPTCATCHGNHAASPPGVANVNAVCGRCHMQADKYFLESPHAAISDFPRCVGCHGGRHGHAIQRLTVPPRELVARFVRNQSLPDNELILALQPGLAMVHSYCTECHDESGDQASDVEAVKRSASILRLISQAEVDYVRLAERVNEVGRGVLLVEDEHLLMSDAQTSVIELGPIQHSLDINQVQGVITQLDDTLEVVRSSLHNKQAKLAWRDAVLWPMWIFIVIFAIASYVKYRRLKATLVKPLH